MENSANKEHSLNYGVYISVWVGLVGLTAITVALTGLNLAGLAVVAALAIAIIKSTMVAGYFMHVRSDSKVFKIFIGLCLAVFLIVVILTFFDLTYRVPLK
jgi:cytochrome c oxidase subunit IV